MYIYIYIEREREGELYCSADDGLVLPGDSASPDLSADRATANLPADNGLSRFTVVSASLQQDTGLYRFKQVYSEIIVYVTYLNDLSMTNARTGAHARARPPGHGLNTINQ